MSLRIIPFDLKLDLLRNYFSGALGTDAKYVNCDAGHAKTARLRFDAYGAQVFGVQIADLPAPDAHKMMVLMIVRFHSKRAMMHADLAQHAAFKKRANVVIDCRQRNRRNLSLHLFVNEFGAGMAVKRHHGLVDNAALMRRRQIMASAKAHKCVTGYHLITFIV